MKIEDEKACSYDYVDIYGGLDDYSGPLYGRYCGLNVSRTFIVSIVAIMNNICVLFLCVYTETTRRNFNERSTIGTISFRWHNE